MLCYVYDEKGDEEAISYDLSFYMKLSLENQNGNILTFNDSYPAVTSDSTIENCLYQ